MRKKNKKQPKKYRGYFTFPLIGAKTQAEFEASMRKYGDFIFQSNVIFKRERLYKVEVHLLSSEGLGWDVTEVSTQNKLTKSELSQVIKQTALSIVNELAVDNTVAVDINQSFIKVALA